MKYTKQCLFILILCVVSRAQAALPPQLAPPLDSLTIYSSAAITMGASSKVGGNIQVEAAATIGASSEVGGHIVAGAAVTLGASVKVDGYIEARDAGTIGADAMVGGYLTTGDAATLGANTIDGNIMVGGHLTAGAAILVGAKAVVDGNLRSGAEASAGLGADAVVRGNAIAGTALTLDADAIVNGDAQAGIGAVALGDSAVVGGNARAGTAVTLAAGARVGGTITSESIEYFTNEPKEPIDDQSPQLVQVQAALTAMVAPAVKLPASMTASTTLKKGIYHATALTTTAGITLTFDGEGEDGHWLINSDTFIAFGASTNMILKDVTPNSTITWNTKGYISAGASSNLIGTFFAGSYILTGADNTLKGIGDTCGGLFTTTGAVTLGASNIIGPVGCTAQRPDIPFAIPVLEYRFDECRYTGDAGDVIDQKGNFSGTSHGISASVNKAVINKLLDLSVDNTSDWVGVPRGTVNGLNDFSVSVWFKTSVHKYQQEIFHALGNNKNDDELEIFLKGEKTVYIKVRDDSEELESYIELTNDRWHHLALTRVGKYVCLFIDGLQQDCDDGVASGTLLVPYPNAVVIGQEQDSFGGGFSKSQNFEGQLDEFKIFNIELSSIQIDRIYQRELLGKNYDGSLRDPLQCDNNCGSTLGELNAVGIKIDSQINTTTEALAIHAAWLAAGSPASGSIDGGKYNVAASGSSTVDRIDFGGSVHDFLGTLPYPGAGVSGTDFLVHTSGILSLPAGKYTIYVESDDGFSFIMDTLSGDAVSFNRFGRSNGIGGNELRFENQTGNTNTGGSFTLSEDSVFDISAIFFERRGGDYLEISIANDIRSNSAPSGYEILRDGALNGKVKFGLCTVSSKINHYQIIHDGQGLTCEAEMVRVKACTNADVETCVLSDEPLVPLSVKAIGSRSITVPVSSTGLGTGKAYIPYTIKDSTLLSLSGTSLLTVCDGGSPDLCNMVFADTGFQFTSNINSNGIPTQLSGKPSNEGYNSSILSLQAIKTNPVSGVCEAALTDPAKIEIVAECIDPIECKGQQVIINGASISTLADSDSPSTYSPVSLDFGDSSDNTAEFTFKYPDAGKVQLHARYKISVDGSSAVDYMQGSSNSFVVRPFGFHINADENENAVDANGKAYKEAGEEFTTSVTAVQWKKEQDNDNDGIPDSGRDLSNNMAAPNFGQESTAETVILTHQLVAPSGGSLGSLSGNTITSFTSGKGQTTNLSWSEVGIIDLTANLSSSSYLDAGAITGTIPYVGRFIPAYFKQTIKATSGNVLGDEGSLTVNHNNDVSECRKVDWAYSGQLTDLGSGVQGSIRYSTPPKLTITAYNNADQITTNYTGDFAKLMSLKTDDKNKISFNAPVTTHSNGLALTGKFPVLGDIVDLGDGVLTYTLSQQDNFVYTRDVNSEVAPFLATFELPFAEFKDSDGVTFKVSDIDSGKEYFETPKFNSASDNPVEIRFGRLVLKNSFGPEAVNLTQPLQVEYFNGNNFIVSADDNCLGYDATKLIPYDIDDLDPTVTKSVGGTGTFFAGETRAIQLEAPDAGNKGDIGVSYDLNDTQYWLQYNWDADMSNGWGNDNPTAVATFGFFRGNDRVIYKRRLN